ncbi:tumor necrosis factor receptor superfamily member 19L isoform X2 [Narcine bancroftii]|uniref:tumor necrosis factor receptor superfamily member 19L isoform X2 n=1 Tax=Narcine bancroftii TaxID=1343680 RepID=UPI0038319035
MQLLTWQSGMLLQCGKREFEDNRGHCVPCFPCAPGQEPDKECGDGKGFKMICRTCAQGTFKDRYGFGSCKPHKDCASLRKAYIRLGTPMTDAACGHCLSGYYTSTEETFGVEKCLPCSSISVETVECTGIYSWLLRVARNTQHAPQAGLSKSSNESKMVAQEKKRTEYAVFALVPVFCIVGLCGILICNLLKKKGYHCTSEKSDEENTNRKLAVNTIPFRSDETNEDTISVLVRLITEKKENAAALQEMLKEHERLEGTTPSNDMAEITSKNASEQFVPLLTIPRLCKHHHVHTVQTSATLLGSSCTRCSQKKWPELLLNTPTRNSSKSVKVGYRVNRPGEITILSIGRFRVTQIPEQKQNLIDGKNMSVSKENDSIDITCDNSMDQKSLLGTKCPKYTTSQQEDDDGGITKILRQFTLVPTKLEKLMQFGMQSFASSLPDFWGDSIHTCCFATFQLFDCLICLIQGGNLMLITAECAFSN